MLSIIERESRLLINLIKTFLLTVCYTLFSCFGNCKQFWRVNRFAPTSKYNANRNTHKIKDTSNYRVTKKLPVLNLAIEVLAD